MRHRRIAEHADDVQQRVGVAERRDVEERLRAGLRAADAGDVGEFDRGRHVLARIEERREPVEPLVGHARRRRRSLPPCRPARGASRALVSSWKSAVLPDDGNPNQSCSEHVKGSPNPRDRRSRASTYGASR